MFWAIGQPLKARHFITFLLYTLCFSNLVTAPTNRLRFLYAERQFPYNWLAFLIVLVLVSLPAYLITGVIVWWIAPKPSAPTIRNSVPITSWRSLKHTPPAQLPTSPASSWHK